MRFSPMVAAFALLLASCDPIYGVASRTTFVGLVDVHCVGTAIMSVPDIGDVHYKRDEAQYTQLLPKIREVREVMHVWSYGEQGKSLLQLTEKTDGWRFTNGRLRMGTPIPDAELARSIPMMQQVERAVASRCGLPLENVQRQ